MLRLFPRFLLLAVLAANAATAALSAFAEDATPPAAASAPGDGISFTPIGGVDGVTVPNPAMLLAIRVQMEPGATAPLVPGSPATGLFMTEAGVFTVQIDAPWSVTRSASAGGAVEAPGAGDVVHLAAGDVASVPADFAGELRNDGDLPAVGVMFLVSPATGDAVPAATPGS